MKACLKRFVYAYNGISAVLKEKNTVIHLIICLVVIISGFVFRISAYEWISVVLCMGLVLSADTFNTAIEHSVNFVSPERNSKAGLIKDIAAAGVLICAVASAVTGMIIFIPKIINLFR